MRTWAEISNSRLAENYRNISAELGAGIAVVGVVKANAYGHGAVHCSRTLVAEGASWLAVSNVEEGLELRKAGLAVRILVMGGVLPDERGSLAEAALTPVIHSLSELQEFDSLGKPLCVHLKLDSGMARLGTRADAGDIASACRSLRHVYIEGLMSHFASPDEPVQTTAQLTRFQEVLSVLNPPFVHAASSLALQNPSALYNMVRPGIALYGYAPVCHVKPVLSWKARILALKFLPTGAPIGYGARYRATRPMQTAVIAAGYADGLPRALTNKGHVVIGNALAPIVGSVSMDLTTVDVTDLPGLREGDYVEIIGHRLDAEAIAQAVGTISYEILTGIGNRVKRIYVD